MEKCSVVVVMVWYGIASADCKFNYRIKDLFVQCITFQELDFDDCYGFLPAQEIL